MAWSLYRGVVVIGILGLMLRLFWKSLSPDISEQEKQQLVWMVTVAFALKTGLVLIWYASVGGLYVDSSVSDQEIYIWGGEYITAQITSGNLFPSLPPQLEHASPGYYYVLGILFTLFERNPIVASLFNTFLSIVLSILIYHLAHSLSGHWVAATALLLNLAYPQYISASYFVLKDITITFLLAVLFWGLYVLKGMLPIPVIVIVMATMAYFRFTQALIGAVLIFGQLMLGTLIARQRIKSFFLLLVTIALLVTFFASVQIGGYTLSNIGYSTNVLAYHVRNSMFLHGERLDFSFRSLTSLARTIGANWTAFLYHSAESLFHTFWGPPYLYSRSGPNLHPYNPTEPPFRVLLESAGAFMMTALMPFVFYGWSEVAREKTAESFFLWTYPLVWVLLLIFSGNSYRWRLPIIPILLLFAALGISKWRQVRPFYPLYVMAFTLLVAVNASLNQYLIVGFSTGSVTLVFLVAMAIWKWHLGYFNSRPRG